MFWLRTKKHWLSSTSMLTATSCNDCLREPKSTDVYMLVYTKSATSLQDKFMQNAARSWHTMRKTNGAYT